MIHITPTNDLIDHKETDTCTCEPQILLEDPETGESLEETVVIHNAWDGRE